jgi:hypothetical protein
MISIEILPEIFAVVRLDPSESILDWIQQSPFHSISKSPDELSIVCRQSDLPSGSRIEKDWAAMRVRGPLDFGLTGILASIAQPLAMASVSVFAISTFDTDYIRNHYITRICQQI